MDKLELNDLKFDSYKDYGNWIWENIEAPVPKMSDLEECGLIKDRPFSLNGYPYRLLTNEEFEESHFYKNNIPSVIRGSLLKRGIIGIYHNVSTKHLDDYGDEFEYRYNTKHISCIERFNNMLSLSNSRLTYNQLIG